MSDLVFAPGAPAADLEAALDDPAFSRPAACGAPILLASCERLEILAFNRPAADRFGDDFDHLTQMLLRSGPAGERLRHLAVALPPDAPARPETIGSLFPQQVEDGDATLLCRRVSASGGRTLLVFAVTGLDTGTAEGAPASSAPENAAPAPRKAAHPFRFTWRADQDGVLQDMAPLPTALGAGPSWIGQSLVQCAQGCNADPEGRLARALERRETFAVKLDWPASAGVLALEIGGTPARQGQTSFGWKGFGLLPTVEAGRAEPDAQETGMAARPPPGNVVPLRPAEGAGVKLSPSERNAFDEIARALAGFGQAAPEPPTAATEDSAPEAAHGGASAPPPLGAEQAILERLPLAVLVSRGNAALLANRALLDWTGYSDVAALEGAGGLETLFAGEALPSEGDTSVVITGAKGTKIPVDARVQAVDWDGAPASLLSLQRAKTAPAAERFDVALREREAECRELHAILDIATDGVAVLDAEGRVLSLNRSAQALFACEPADAVGQPLWSFVAEDSRQILTDYLDLIVGGGVASVLNDGRDILCRAGREGSIPVFVTIGRIAAEPEPKFCAVLRDLTPWKQAERQLGDARREAERASALKSDFLAKVSHEIRTPLNAILGFAEVMMDERFGPLGNERYKEYLKDIHRSGEHVMSLVNDLLDLSKIEAGKLEMTFTTVDANAVVSECVALLQPEASRERVVMRLSLSPRLPRVVADERALRQIVLNVLSNAVKYNQPGGQVIVSTAQTDAGHAVVRVRDTGLGMSEAEIEAALEPFRQIPTARAATATGTGLGLPLTKALAEATRAHFSIRSRPEEGTLVEIAFPPSRVMAG